MLPSDFGLKCQLAVMCVNVSVVAGQKLRSAGVVVDMFPLHNPDQLKGLSEAWYSGNQLAQPLGEWKHTRHTHTLPHD